MAEIGCRGAWAALLALAPALALLLEPGPATATPTPTPVAAPARLAPPAAVPALAAAHPAASQPAAPAAPASVAPPARPPVVAAPVGPPPQPVDDRAEAIARDVAATPPQKQVPQQDASRLRTSRLTLGGLLDRPVHGAENSEVGRVIDVMVGEDGQPAALELDVGGFMGVGNRRIAVAWALFDLSKLNGSEPLRVALTEAQVKSAPAADGAEVAVVTGAYLPPAPKPIAPAMTGRPGPAVPTTSPPPPGGPPLAGAPVPGPAAGAAASPAAVPAPAPEPASGTAAPKPRSGPAAPRSDLH